MNSIKQLGIAMAVASVAFAFLGVPSASARHVTGLCEERATGLCPTGKRIIPPSGVWTKVLGRSTSFQLSNNGFFSTPETCTAELAIEISEEQSNYDPEKSNLKGTVPVLTEKFELEPEGSGKFDEPKAGLLLTSCSGPCTTAQATNLPWEVELTMASEAEGNEEFKLSSAKGGVHLTGCTFGTACEYGVPKGGSLNFSVSNNAEGGTITAKGVTLEYKAGSGAFLCGTTLSLTSTLAVPTCHLFKNSKSQGLHSPCYWTLLQYPR